MIKLPKHMPHNSNLHRRFVLRVLLPPFIALFALTVITLIQLGSILRQQSESSLLQAANTASVALEREFEIRETVLVRTGEELQLIKSEYDDSRLKLEQQYSACFEHVRTGNNYVDAPDNSCQVFADDLAQYGNRSTVVSNSYVRNVEQLNKDEGQRISERLGAFKQFFPETLALVLVNKDNKVISSALSGAFKGSTKNFLPYSNEAIKNPVNGDILILEGYKLSVFAFPMKSGGSILAAYDVFNEQFIRKTWDDAPIDRSKEIVAIYNSTPSLVYPNLKNESEFKSLSSSLNINPIIESEIGGVPHTIVSSASQKYDWHVAVATPNAAIASPILDTQLGALIFIGLFMVVFTWVGTYFIQRTLNNIVRLVSGAMIFSTGRLNYKIELDHADKEFIQLGETMNLMAERIAAAEKAIDEKNKEFISVATHEIRAPLTAIIGHLSLLQDMYSDKLDKQANELINQAHYGSARLKDLVNDMLNAARLESGHNELLIQNVDPEHVIGEVVSTMKVVAKIKEINIIYHKSEARKILADEAKFRIVINNFVSNAIKYNNQKGHINISHEVTEDQLVTSVSDNGLGIPEDQKTHMFEKFFRVSHDDRKAVTGTGLGMYITKEYIEQMGGRLWFESEHGKGTTFFFSLPLAKESRRERIKSKAKRSVAKIINKKKAKKSKKNRHSS